MEYICKKCGAVIVPGKTSKGKKINFDAGQPVYIQVGSDAEGVIADLEPEALIDHDRICGRDGSTLMGSFLCFIMACSILLSGCASPDHWKSVGRIEATSKMLRDDRKCRESLNYYERFRDDKLTTQEYKALMDWLHEEVR